MTSSSSGNAMTQKTSIGSRRNNVSSVTVSRASAERRRAGAAGTLGVSIATDMAYASSACLPVSSRNASSRFAWSTRSC